MKEENKACRACKVGKRRSKHFRDSHSPRKLLDVEWGAFARWALLRGTRFPLIYPSSLPCPRSQGTCRVLPLGKGAGPIAPNQQPLSHLYQAPQPISGPRADFSPSPPPHLLSHHVSPFASILPAAAVSAIALFPLSLVRCLHESRTLPKCQGAPRA